MAVVTARDTWSIDNQANRRTRGPLVKVEIRPGQYVKMYEADAIAKGLIVGKGKPAAGDKIRPAETDKMRPPGGDKGKEGDLKKTAEAVTSAPDDFTVISGVGKATARALVANGILTFEQLKEAAQLSFLSAQVMQAIETWRSGNESSDI